MVTWGAFRKTPSLAANCRTRVNTGDEHHDGAIAADIDGDGDVDIISIGWEHGKVLLYENMGLRNAVGNRPK